MYSQMFLQSSSMFKKIFNYIYIYIHNIYFRVLNLIFSHIDTHIIYLLMPLYIVNADFKPLLEQRTTV